MRRFLLIICSLPFLVWCQDDDTVRVTLQEVEVREQPVYRPGVPNQLVKLNISSPVLNISNSLNLIAGASSQEGAANTAKFSYRGFGARSQYTTSRTLFYLDEIPLTTLQGFSTFEDINPLYLEAAILHSPGTNAFPNALGSIVQLRTREEWNDDFSSSEDLPQTPNQIRNVFTAGSFGLISENVFYTNSSQGLTIGYENGSSDGWRENSDFQRQSIFLNGNDLFNRNLQVLLYALKNKAGIPSSLSLDDYLSTPEIAAESWAEINGYEQYEKLITGVTYSNRDSSSQHPKTYYTLTVFYQYRNGFEPRPFNILDDVSHHGGLRASFEKPLDGKRKGAIRAFAEYHLGTEEATTFENRYDSIAATFNNKGAEINSTNLTTQLINAGLSFSSGLFGGEHDHQKLKYQLALNAFYRSNRFNEGKETEYNSPLLLAPRLEVAYYGSLAAKAMPVLQIYRSYSIPSLEENLDPDGSINAELKPEMAWTGELGLKGAKHGLMPHFFWNSNIYYSEVQNLIVPRVVGPDQVVATNSGSSRHSGLELDFGFEDLKIFTLTSEDVVKSRAFTLSLWAGGYYGYFAYKSFSDTSGSFDNNRLPGFPEWQASFTSEISYGKENRAEPNVSRQGQFTLGLQYRGTGGYFINDQNSVRNQPFWILQSWLDYSRLLTQQWLLSGRVGIKNLTDQQYAAMTVVNNQSFGGSMPRYYYPGEPLNWFLSLTVAYRF